MDQRARSYLLQNRQALESDIKTSYIMDHMVADDTLTVMEEEKVKAQTTRKERAAMLLKLIIAKDNYAYISFYNALQQEGYKDLAALLQDGLPIISPSNKNNSEDGITSYVKTTLCEGGVPQRPVVFVTRPKLLKEIQKNLCRLGNDPGLVIVYGMAGCGKSVLAECIYTICLYITKHCYFLELHWAPNLLKVDVPFIILFCNRSLLVLDDIWESWVLKAFDNQCQILITSRDRSIADSVTGNKYEVSVESGLTHEKALEILSVFVNMKVTELPEQADHIVRECKGSPLVVSLIGALLRDFPNRWEYYLRQLQNKQFKRIRKSSSYDYDALDEAMSISVDMLPENFKVYYRDLSVLQKDVKVPSKVLCILWDMEIEEVEDILQEFVNKSLLFCDRNGKSFCYYLHALQLDFLMEKNRSELQDLHKKVVHQFKKYYKCYIPISSEEDCMYWYNFLAYHMAGANMHDELCALMFSLDWIKIKTELVGPAHLIHEYVEYSKILDQKDTNAREDFQEFLSLNGHLLGHLPFLDIVQLGLCQPENSEVYRQAKLRAQQELSKGSLYVEWINKTSVKNMYRLVVHPHTDAVYHACFSQDHQRIATCGADKTLQVFKTESGEKLLEVKAHDDEVLCCAFSMDDRFLATCSMDKKVKVWNSRTGELVCELEEHTEQVNFCHFSNHLLATCSNDTHIKASCSADGTLKLWDVQAANHLKTINIGDFFKNGDGYHDEVEVLVKCCSWSSNSTAIVVAAKNKLFLVDVETKELLVEALLSHHNTIQYCDFCPNSKIVAVALSHCSVEIWNIESISKIAECLGHMSWVHSVNFSLDGSFFVTSSDDQTIRIWETNKVCKSSVIVLNREIDVSFLDNEVNILAIGSLKHLQVNIVSDRSVLKSSIGHRKAVQHCQFTSDGKTLISSSDDSTIQVWNWQSEKHIILKGHKEPVKNFHLLKQSRLLSWSFDGTIKVWNILTGELEKDLTCHEDAVLSCAVSPDATIFSTTSADKTAKIWSFKNPSALHTLSGHKDCVRCCTFSLKNELLATGDDHGEIRVWSISTGKLLCLCFSATTNEGGSAYGGWVTGLHFSPDGKVLVSSGGYIKWWNVDTDQSLQTFYTNGTNLKSLHVSPDFKTCVTLDNLGILYVLQIME
uniref:Apoptotic peptidase activating factor 1 n=1 Tax=Naja naja TaxID=35670 RepID=A0A8C6X9H4_NAJNA